MEACELSEGELPDSSSSSNASPNSNSPDNHSGEDNEESPDSPPPVKKKKGDMVRDYSEPGLYGQAGHDSLTGKQRKRKRKQELRKVENEKKRLLQVLAEQNQGLSYLTLHQVDILKGLISLNKGENVASNLHKLKTANFQELISHLVCGSPATMQALPGDDELRKNRVVVAWIAMVSEEFFSSTDNHFPRLKSLNPSLQFKIEHPGSARFVKLGLEPFFCSGQANEPTQPKPQLDSARPSRIFYLLSKQQLKDHDFPVPDPAIPPGYANVTDWPEEALQVALKSEEPPMFAIDCEMVETKEGSELARVSIVNESLDCIYDSLVKPDNPVTDYRTRYSGIDEEKLKDVSVSLSDVQQIITKLLPPNSIILGHSLDCDFKALKFIHPYVIDTSCIFTPNATPTCKPGLRKLAKELLSMEIQKGSHGHSPIEDATACMQLVQLKIRSGPSCTISFNQCGPNVITDYRAQGKNTGFVDRGGVVRFFGRGASCSYEVDTDKDCIEKAHEIIPQCDFTFLQLHEMEMFFKGNKTHSTEQDVAKALDNSIVRLVEGCPEGTLLFVVCGSGDIREVRRLQQDDMANPTDLRKAVFCARTGLVVALVVS